jgi:hypothetical protein
MRHWMRTSALVILVASACGGIEAEPVTVASEWVDGEGNPVISEAGCDPSAVGETTTAPGATQPVCTSANVIEVHEGHCGWDGLFLSVDVEDESIGHRTYVRDESSVPEDAITTKSASDAALPPDAIDTGFHTGHVQLWISTARDQESAYLVDEEGGTERWPEVVFGCA